MSNLKTTADLLDDALRKSGEKIDGTSDYEIDALNYMNSFHRAVLSGGNEFDVELGEPWSWAKSRYPGVLTLLPAHTTGSVALTKGSAAGTFSSAPASSLAGRFLKVSDRPEYFRIATHVAGAAAFTLDGEYTDDTTAGAEFKAHKLDYDLDATRILRLAFAMNVYRSQTDDGDDEGKVVGLDFGSFQKKNPLHKIQAGTPTEFCVMYASDNSLIVRFNKSVLTETRVEYDHIPVPADLTDSDSSLPLIPDGFRQILSYATAHAIMVDKEDDKAKYFYDLTKVKLGALVQANRKELLQVSRNRGRLIPRPDLMSKGKSWLTSG